MPKNISLTIERMPRGGYVVREQGAAHTFWPTLFACTDIDDALGFIKGEIGEPETVEKAAPSPLQLDVGGFLGPEPMPCGECGALPGTMCPRETCSAAEARA